MTSRYNPLRRSPTDSSYYDADDHDGVPLLSVRAQHVRTTIAQAPKSPAASRKHYPHWLNKYDIRAAWTKGSDRSNIDVMFHAKGAGPSSDRPEPSMPASESGRLSTSFAAPSKYASFESPAPERPSTASPYAPKYTTYKSPAAKRSGATSPSIPTIYESPTPEDLNVTSPPHTPTICASPAPE